MDVCSIKGYSTSFKSNNNTVLGYDDSVSASRRSYIREHYMERVLPHYDILENNGRLDEYQLEKLITGLVGKKVDIRSINSILSSSNNDKFSNESGYEIMQKLPLLNIKLIPSVNSYRGSTAANNPEALPLLKKAGIRTVVDLHGYDTLEKACRENGLDYLFFHVPEYLDEQDVYLTQKQYLNKVRPFYQLLSAAEARKALERDAANWQKRLDSYLDLFVKFILTMQQENVYIGCEFGTCRTNNALMLNHFFNPKACKTPDCITEFNKKFLPSLETFYHNLDSKHKTLMGWTDEFDKMFLTKLKKAGAASLK